MSYSFSKNQIMKKLAGFMFVAGMFLLGFSFSSCTDEEIPLDNPITLTDIEEENLRFMREEEKLARDVYTHLGSIYDLPIFENISASEQKHINFVLDVMEQYGLEDTGTDEPGVFTIPALQELYNTLIEAGEPSLLDALTVGATIEDVDIKDLLDALDQTNNSDLTELFELLKCGSGNHMRAFTSQIKNQGGEYVPQYISQELYEEILNAGHESCNGH
jgi:hypothetical protein